MMVNGQPGVSLSVERVFIIYNDSCLVWGLPPRAVGNDSGELSGRSGNSGNGFSVPDRPGFDKVR
jgi:hypothetical protein